MKETDLEFCLIFKTRNGTLYHNDEEICVIFKDIADEFIPGVALYCCEIKCSVFGGSL